MKVLVINAGSSSLKYQLLKTKSGEVLAKGNADRIGLDNSFIKHSRNGEEIKVIPVVLADHTDAIKAVI
ncbi:MAG: acetate kinase, partial [Eubacteriales bacterium]|nr:acetate kinase [Eubacteriales bacterium]